MKTDISWLSDLPFLLFLPINTNNLLLINQSFSDKIYIYNNNIYNSINRINRKEKELEGQIMLERERERL